MTTITASPPIDHPVRTPSHRPARRRSLRRVLGVLLRGTAATVVSVGYHQLMPTL